MIGLFFSGLFGGALGILKRVFGFLASVNWTKVWPYIAAVLCVLFAFLWLNARSDERHENKLRVAAETSLSTLRKQLADEQVAAAKWKRQAEATQAAISKDIGDRHEKDLRTIDARADDQRVRGPGKADAGPVCPAVVPARPGGHDPASGRADPGVAGLPPESGLAIVPWSGLVNAAQGADADRSEVIAWREWYAREKAARDAAGAGAVKAK